MPLFESYDLLNIGGLVVSIASLILAILFYYKGKNRKVLEYQIDSMDLITKDMASIPGISITIFGKSVENMTSSTIKFTNVGNQTISSDDFGTLEPLGVLVIGQFFNADRGLNFQSDSLSSFPFVKSTDTGDIKRHVEIDIDFVKPKQSFSITFLHDGPLRVSGVLKTGKIVKARPHAAKSGIVLDIIAIFSGILSLSLLALSLHIASDLLLAVSQIVLILSLLTCMFSIVLKLMK